MQNRDIYFQINPNQAYRQDTDFTANNMITGISNDYRNYDPSSSRFSAVAPTRASLIDPQRGFANLKGLGRYATTQHFISNTSTTVYANINRISYLSPSASRPNNYFWGQDFQYTDPTKAAFANQATNGLSFYRLSDGNKVIVDQFTNSDQNWLYYNYSAFDNNLLTISNAGAVSKIETITQWQDNTNTPATPLLFQTHGGIGADAGGTMVTDYSRDTHWQADDRDTYIMYRPNFGSNVNIPENVETMGEWGSNATGQRSGSWHLCHLLSKKSEAYLL